MSVNNKGEVSMFTIFGLDVQLTLLNIPFNFEYELTVGKDKKHPHKPPHGPMAAAEE